MDLARAPRRAPLTARKKGSGYENVCAPLTARFKKTDILVKDLDGNFACFKHCIKQIILDLVSLSNGNFASFKNTNIPDE